MDEQLVSQTEAFLTAKLNGGAYLAEHPAAKAYRLAHSRRVANIGRQIALKEGFDETETVIACLLHDVAYCEDFGENGWKEHGRRSAQIARPFLLSLGLASARVEAICFAIAIHVDDAADFPGKRTAFALTVGDADNIDRFDVYRLHESLCHDRFLEMSAEESREYIESRLTRLRELRGLRMGTGSAQALWDERLSFSISFFERLSSQLASGCGILP